MKAEATTIADNQLVVKMPETKIVKTPETKD